MGVDFRKRQKKMLFVLTTLNVAYVSSTPELEENVNETVEELHKRNKWDNDTCIYRGYIKLVWLILSLTFKNIWSQQKSCEYS